MDLLTEKFVELCNDVGVMVEVRDIEPVIDCFKKKVTQKNFCEVCQ